MKIRDDIAELLLAGMPQAHICRELRCSPLTVQRTREALGLPAPKTCRVLPTTPEAAFAQYTRPIDGGHLQWAGPLKNRAPFFVHQGQHHYARPFSFRLQHGRGPIGNVTPSCTVERCVAGRCLQDRPMREHTNSLYKAIFGGTA
ncbi:helix-turn-helix domain-containing protein [Streptomyces canus]|uniref:helix-turn-helix domain-containing protein n=1 Tax=Streptomyces canus TaxID=58343 RepID=UPI0003710E06|nr:helix-turn-helix domain-containing protein [Streptomyces canus]